MKLYDVVYGHEVGTVDGNIVTSRWGWTFKIKGYAVVDEGDEIYGSFVDGVFSNAAGKKMAALKGCIA